MRVLFYAINGVGLGHAARLSVLQQAIEHQASVGCYFFSNCSIADGIFSCRGLVVREDPYAPAAETDRKIFDGLFRSLQIFRPHVMVCDTYWPKKIIAELRRSGIRTVLIMRMMNPRVMRRRLQGAFDEFDTVLVPHHPEEVLWTYRKHPRLTGFLESLPLGFVGPIARRAANPRPHQGVIFTLGGGGESPGASRANRVEVLLKIFSETARLLVRNGYAKPALAAGPLLKFDSALHTRFHIIQTNRLHDHYGPDTVVVSRGGYNTCWEAIAAGSRLIVCGSHQAEEDVQARCAFLQRQAVARKVRPSARVLLEAIQQVQADREHSAVERWSRIVNAGVPLVVDELLGGTFLRAREKNLPHIFLPATRVHRKPLVARFDDVNPVNPGSVLLKAARCASESGYRTQLHLMRAIDGYIDPDILRLADEAAELWTHGWSHDRERLNTYSQYQRAIEVLSSLTKRRITGASFPFDVPPRRLKPLPSGYSWSTLHRMERVKTEVCVDVLAWPGPRLRNELGIHRDLLALIRQDVITGLCLHTDRMPPFLSEYLLQLFSLYNTS